MEEKYLGDNWLFERLEKIKLYHDIAVLFRLKVGVIDTYTHHNLRQVIENKPFSNIWGAEVLGTREKYKNCDHYIIFQSWLIILAINDLFLCLSQSDFIVPGMNNSLAAVKVCYGVGSSNH